MIVTAQVIDHVLIFNSEFFSFFDGFHLRTAPGDIHRRNTVGMAFKTTIGAREIIL